MRSLVEPLESRTFLCFAAAVTSAGGGDSISVGDFNKDGRDDIVHFAGTNRVAVSLSNGDGTFRKTSSLSGLTGDPWLVFKPADLNGDGRLDVQAAGYRSLIKTTGRTASKTTVGTAGAPAGACLQGG